MNQKEFLGHGSIRHISDILNACKAKRILLVTGKKSYQNSGAEDALRPLLNNFEVIRFSDFEPNPRFEDVLVGIELVYKYDFDIIIAIGGGSVIDMSKSINLLSSHKTDDASEIIKDTRLVKHKGLPFVAIPTTSGSGSEATHFAVVYINKIKYSLAHEYVLPDYAIVDPIFTYKLPPNIIASSGLDAFTQAIESYWAVGSTVESKEYAQKAIKILLKNIEKAVCDNDKKSLDEMALASNLAGKAINISKTTAAHAISYPITTNFNVPHGHAVALTLGNFFIINYLFSPGLLIDSRGEDYLKKTMHDLFALLECHDAESCSKWWFNLVATLGLKNNTRDIGISSDDVNLILDNVNIERLNNNPVKLTRESLVYALTNGCDNSAI